MVMQCVWIPARARGATQNRTPRTRPEQLSGAAFPPRPPLLDSAFAGGGLNIRHERVCARSHPNPYSLWTFAWPGKLFLTSPASALRCGLPIGASCGVVTIRGGVTLAAAPALARAAAVAASFRGFPNSLSQSGRAHVARAPWYLSRPPYLKPSRGRRPFGLQRLPQR